MVLNLRRDEDATYSTGGIIEPIPRGGDRRKEARAGETDWRVNPRFYEFIGAIFDPLTPMQTLSRAKWITSNHGFRYIVTPNVDHLVRLHKEPEVYGPLYAGAPDDLH